MQERVLRIGLSALIGFFCVAQLLLVWNGGTLGVFNSPDANANYHFAERLYRGESFAHPLPAVPDTVQEYLFTRSTKVSGDALLPVGFLGLSISYGLISKALFINLIPYLTLVLAALGILFFARLIAFFFSPEIGYIAAMLLSIHPAWWHYTNESLMPNVPFMSLLIIGSALLVSAPRTARWQFILAGACIAAALWFRLAEIVWVIPFTVIIGMSRFIRDRTIGAAVPFSIIAGIIAGFAFWALQWSLTDTGALFGYVVPATNTPGSVFTSLLVPFGFHPRLIILHAAQYGAVIFWPYTAALIIALWLSGRSLFRKGQLSRWFIGASWFASFIIFIYYGSWLIADTPDPSQTTIGTSFVRYFLPWYVFGMLPIIASGIVKIRSIVSEHGLQYVIGGILIMGALFTYSVSIVGSPESIMAKRVVLQGYETIARWVVTETPEDALVLTAKSDKYIWPHRAVITSYADNGGLYAARLYHDSTQASVYYSGVTMDDAAVERFDVKLKEAGLRLGNPLYTYSDVSVYQIEAYDDEIE